MRALPLLLHRLLHPFTRSERSYTSPFNTAASAFRIEEPAAPMTAIKNISTYIYLMHGEPVYLLL